MCIYEDWEVGINRIQGIAYHDGVLHVKILYILKDPVYPKYL